MSQTKIDYKRWLYGRHLIERLQEAKFSLTEIATVAVGHGSTPGWASHARHNRSIMKESHVRKMEKMLMPPKIAKKGRLPGETPIKTADQRRCYRKLLERLNVYYGWTTGEIASALNYGSSGGVLTAMKKGAGTLQKLQAATAIVGAMDAEVPDNDGLDEETIDPSLAVPVDPQMNGKGSFEAIMSAARTDGQVFLSRLRQLENNMPPFMKGNMNGFIQQVEEMVDQLG